MAVVGSARAAQRLVTMVRAVEMSGWDSIGLAVQLSEDRTEPLKAFGQPLR